MKSGSDNFRDSAAVNLIKILKKKESNIIIFEPNVDGKHFMDVPAIKDFDFYASFGYCIGQ